MIAARTEGRRRAKARRRVSAVAAGLLALIGLLLATLAYGGTAAPPPSGVFIYEHVTKTGRWLESRDLGGGSRVALTPPLARGELRTDCCARWLPRGKQVVFQRRTPKLNGLYVVDADGSHLKQVVSTADLPQRANANSVSFRSVHASGDGSKLVFTVDDLHDCNSDGIYRINTDGTDLRALARRPARLTAALYALGWSPDGKTAAFDLSHNDGDCYGSHVGPEELKIVTDDGSNATVTLVKTDAIGGAGWLPDGSGIVYSDCGYGAPCNLWLVPPNGSRSPLPITRFQTSASPYGGFDELQAQWSGQGNELILARARSLFSLDPTTGQLRRLVTAPCPRPSGRCPLPELTLYGISPDRVAVIDAGDVGCTLCYSNSPRPISKRYAVSLSNRAFTQLPDPGLAVDDVYLP